jgi:hypothetical protein
MIIKVTHEKLILLIILVLVVLACVMTYNGKNKKEKFINRRVVGSTFGQYYPPNPNPNPHQGSCSRMTAPNPNSCTPENNCFPGSTLRTEVYQNLCNDPSSGINKLPIQLNDTCLRTHNPNMSPNLVNLKCSKNLGGQVNCTY